MELLLPEFLLDMQTVRRDNAARCFLFNLNANLRRR